MDNIGISAPLVTQTQWDMLMRALAYVGFKKFGTDIPMFEDIMRDLSLHPETYGFDISKQNELKEIQEAFGIIVNPDYTVSGTTPVYSVAGDINNFQGISEDMQGWWRNFRTSRLEIHGKEGNKPSILQLIQEWYESEQIYSVYLYDPHLLQLTGEP
ncbi:MAG: hypothetical protein ACTSVL_10305 [Promethearchaeota archaeon]